MVLLGFLLNADPQVGGSPQLSLKCWKSLNLQIKMEANRERGEQGGKGEAGGRGQGQRKPRLTQKDPKAVAGVKQSSFANKSTSKKAEGKRGENCFVAPRSPTLGSHPWKFPGKPEREKRGQKGGAGGGGQGGKGEAGGRGQGQREPR